MGRTGGGGLMEGERMEDEGDGGRKKKVRKKRSASSSCAEIKLLVPPRWCYHGAAAHRGGASVHQRPTMGPEPGQRPGPRGWRWKDDNEHFRPNCDLSQTKTKTRSLSCLKRVSEHKTDPDQQICRQFPKTRPLRQTLLH